MKESAVALGKVRGYCYLIFLFDILLLFHNEIADFYSVSDSVKHSLRGQVRYNSQQQGQEAQRDSDVCCSP